MSHLYAVLLSFGAAVTENEGDPLFGWDVGEWLLALLAVVVVAVIIVIVVNVLRRIGLL